MALGRSGFRWTYVTLLWAMTLLVQGSGMGLSPAALAAGFDGPGGSRYSAIPPAGLITPGVTGFNYYGPKYPAPGLFTPGPGSYPPHAPLYSPNMGFYPMYRPSYVAPQFDFGYVSPFYGTNPSRATIIYATPTQPEATQQYSTRPHVVPQPRATQPQVIPARPLQESSPETTDLDVQQLRPGMVLPDGSVVRSVGPLRPLSNPQVPSDSQPTQPVPAEEIPPPIQED